MEYTINILLSAEFKFQRSLFEYRLIVNFRLRPKCSDVQRQKRRANAEWLIGHGGAVCTHLVSL